MGGGGDGRSLDIKLVKAEMKEVDQVVARKSEGSAPALGNGKRAEETDEVATETFGVETRKSETEDWDAYRPGG